MLHKDVKVFWSHMHVESSRITSENPLSKEGETLLFSSGWDWQVGLLMWLVIFSMPEKLPGSIKAQQSSRGTQGA